MRASYSPENVNLKEEQEIIWLQMSTLIITLPYFDSQDIFSLMLVCKDLHNFLSLLPFTFENENIFALKPNRQPISPILQKYISYNALTDEEVKNNLLSLLETGQFRQAIIDSGAFTDEQLIIIEKIHGNRFTSYSDFGFYILVNKLIPYDEMINAPIKDTCTSFIGDFCSERGVRALENKLLTYTQYQQFINLRPILLESNTLDLIEAGFISAEHLCMTCTYNVANNKVEHRQAHLLAFVQSDYGKYALKYKLIPLDQAKCIGGLRALLTKNGIIALEQGYITPKQATEFSPYNLELLLTEGFEALISRFIIIDQIKNIQSLKGYAWPKKRSMALSSVDSLKNISMNYIKANLNFFRKKIEEEIPPELQEKLAVKTRYKL